MGKIWLKPNAVKRFCVFAKIVKISGCESPSIVESTKFDERFPAENVLKLEKGDLRDSKKRGNYWLAADRKSKGEGFKVDLNCDMLASAIILKNTHNGNYNGHYNGHS